MFIPGFVISILTFPGVIVHEFAHLLFCRIFKVAVFDVCFFQFANPAGYVLHETPRKVWHHVMIGVGPFFTNTIIGTLIAIPAVYAFRESSDPSLVYYLLFYFGVSIAMHSFPSTGDANSIWNAVYDNSENASAGIKIIAAPILILIYLGAFGSILWLDLLYGVGVTRFFANMLLKGAV